MKNDVLSKIWNNQNTTPSFKSPNDIIKKAQKQRNGQLITILVLVTTLLLVVSYSIYYASFELNNFTIGLFLMVFSLAFRITLELVSLYRKENKIISMDAKSFRNYLKKYYELRIKVNYTITPICFIAYILGFIKLLPYFEDAFSKTFYLYIVISGFISFFALSILILKSILKENQFLRELKSSIKK